MSMMVAFIAGALVDDAAHNSDDVVSPDVTLSAGNQRDAERPPSTRLQARNERRGDNLHGAEDCRRRALLNIHDELAVSGHRVHAA